MTKRSASGRMRRVDVVHTRRQSLTIWKSAVATEFRVAGAVHARHHQQRHLTGLAWDMLAAGALLGRREEPRSILMLGLAGGTAFRILRLLLPGCRLTGLDIDGEIIALARRHMDLDALAAEVLVADAYQWLELNQRTFDVVIDDIYLAGKTDVFRPRSWDPSLLRHLCRAVSPGGVLAVNLVTGPGHRNVQTAARRVLRAHFPVVRTVTSDEAMNEVLVAGEDVATRHRLDRFEQSFANPRDRKFWRGLRVRRID